VTPGFSQVACQAPQPEPRLPLVVGAFRLVDSTKSDSVTGSGFSYADTAGTRVEVFLYSVPATRRSESASTSLEREARAFLLSLQHAQADRQEPYQVIVDTVRGVETDAGSIPVRVIVFVFERPEGTFVSFAHLLVLAGHYLNVRLTLPTQVWRNSSAPNFALDLVKCLHSRERKPL